MSKADKPEPKPTAGRDIVLTAVLQDLRDRAEAGKLKYGTYLMTHNGRNALMDAYQEALDLCMYLKQALMEQEKPSVSKPQYRYTTLGYTANRPRLLVLQDLENPGTCGIIVTPYTREQFLDFTEEQYDALLKKGSI